MALASFISFKYFFDQSHLMNCSFTNCKNNATDKLVTKYDEESVKILLCTPHSKMVENIDIIPFWRVETL